MFVNTIRYIDFTKVPIYKGFKDLFLIVDVLLRYV